MEVTSGILYQENNLITYWFEVTKNGELVASGNLYCENGTAYDYDGVFEINGAICQHFENMGIFCGEVM